MTGELSEYEKLRLKNIADRQKCFNEYMKQNGLESFEISKVKFDAAREEKPKESWKKRERAKRETSPPTFVPIRRSLRNSASRKRYSEVTSPDEKNMTSYAEDDSDFIVESYLELPPKRKKLKKSFNENRDRVIVPIEDVTDEMLSNIAYSSKKKYSAENGSTCHQCRQKTIDTKTACRSDDCVGVRGQFCGPCLKNRYGESVADALLNPEWKCPVCRDLCNCSICRNRKGFKPTGILVPHLRYTEHTNVSDFLQQFS